MSTTFLIPLILASLFFAPELTAAGAEKALPSSAEAALRKYLAMAAEPPLRNVYGEGRAARLGILRALAGAPNALAIVQATFPSITNGWQRAELAEMLGRQIQTKDSALALINLLNDPDESVRLTALHGLRLMACRIDRGGRHGIQAEPAHEAKVDGLVPTLIFVGHDRSPQVRWAALYALADTREPQAIVEIREHLQDSDRDVRFAAACLLTEVKDASGMGELKEGLRRLNEPHPNEEFPYHVAEEVMLAFERITGKSFGELPLNPSLSSDLRKTADLAVQYHSLVDAWTRWWNWTGQAN